MKQLTKAVIIGAASILAAYGLAFLGVGFFKENALGAALVTYVAGTLFWRPIHIMDRPLSEAARTTPLTSLVHMFWLVSIFAAGVLLCAIA